MRLKDRRGIKFLKPPSTQTVEPKKISLKEYLDRKPTQVTSTTTTTEHQGDDCAQDLSLPAPSIEWGHMVNQLNQDPQADLIVDSGHGTAVMEEGGADVAGDEEVEGRDESHC